MRFRFAASIATRPLDVAGVERATRKDKSGYQELGP